MNYAQGGVVGREYDTEAVNSPFDQIEKSISVLEDNLARLFARVASALQPSDPSPSVSAVPQDGRPRSPVVLRLGQLDDRIAGLAQKVSTVADLIDLP